MEVVGHSFLQVVKSQAYVWSLASKLLILCSLGSLPFPLTTSGCWEN